MAAYVPGTTLCDFPVSPQWLGTWFGSNRLMCGGQPQGWQEKPRPRLSSAPVNPCFLLPPPPCGPFLGPGSPAWHCDHCATVDVGLATSQPRHLSGWPVSRLPGRGQQTALRRRKAPDSRALTQDRGRHEVSAGVGRLGLVETPQWTGDHRTPTCPRTEKSPSEIEGREKGAGSHFLEEMARE